MEAGFEASSSGHRYIGSSIAIELRFRQHKNKLISGKHHNICLQRLFNKVGLQGMEFRIVEVCDSIFVRAREQFWLWNRPGEYNISKAAEGCAGHKCTPEQIENRRKSGAMAFLGRRHSEVSKWKMIVAQLKRFNGASWEARFVLKYPTEGWRLHEFR